jgi:hypothetical protein
VKLQERFLENYLSGLVTATIYAHVYDEQPWEHGGNLLKFISPRRVILSDLAGLPKP